MKIRYVNRLEHLVAFNRFHLHHSPTMRLQTTWMPLIVAILMILAGLRMSQYGGIRMLAVAVTLVVVFLGFVKLFKEFNVSILVKRQLKEGSNSAVLCEHVLEVTPEWLIETTPLSELRSRWTAIERMETTPDYTFLYTQATAAHVIPRAEIIEGDYDAFVDAIRRLVPRK